MFFVEEGASKLKQVPQKVVDSTTDFLSAECAASLRDWLDNNMAAVEGAKNAITKTTLLSRLKHISPFNDLKPKELEDALTRTCRVSTSKGFRERIKYDLKGGDVVYIKEDSV